MNSINDLKYNFLTYSFYQTDTVINLLLAYNIISIIHSLISLTTYTVYNLQINI